ncbi:hypothetical protein ABZW03_20790 [Kitasatospora sp. NPDC004799]|uniref:hypothetical protein n=1 Tax=Kitasatospora sp. NPDC004799 TaxID=3154460 RepID=UPI0033BE5342
MAEFEVPGPEPHWQPATIPPYGTGRNPASQQSMWEYAAPSFRLVAGLKPALEALAARLRLTVERGWEDLGAVEVAMFRIQRVDFALSRLEGGAEPSTFVWVGRSEQDADAALELLLGALGLGPDALAFRGDVETGFERFDGSSP